MAHSNNSTGGREGNHFQILSLELPCQYCRVLQLNDEAQGGVVRHDKKGERFVYFGEIQEKFSSRPGANSAASAARAGLGKSDDTIETWPRLQLKLDYKREDTLPGLLSTGSLGCSFCKILRGDVMSVWDKLLEETRRGSQLNHNGSVVHQAALTFTGITYQLYEAKGINEGERDDGQPGRVGLDSLYVFFTINCKGDKNDYSLHYNVYADATDPCTSWFQIQRSPLSNDQLSPPLISRLKDLIDKSLLEVPAPAQDGAYYPTRLLDVGSNMCTELRLVILATDPAFTKGESYAALSYCWGSEEEAENQLKTTSATIQSHILQIVFGCLPQTVADAVQVCRSLGIRYLWVDALCIIQDNKDDWAREAFEMANVYAKSFITLCILQGNSCASGFLENRHAPDTLQINLRSSLDSSDSKRTMDTLINGSPDKPANLDLNRSAWRDRGWTFQESWLSPRKLFFGPSMFHLSCGNRQESADGSRFEDDEFFPGTEKDLSQGLNQWYRLVKQYGSRLLSYKQDRLPALSAFPRTVVKMFPDQEYLAGLWKSDLHRGLLWTPYSWSDLPTYREHPEGYIAPSWSWASHPYGLDWVNGVNTGHYVISPEFELRDANIVTEALNPYARVSSGTLELDAKLFQLPLYKGEGSVIEKPDSERRWLGVIFHYTLLSKEGEYVASLHLDWITLGQKKHPDDSLHFDQLWMVLTSRSSLNNIFNHFNPREDKNVTDPEIMLGLLLLPTGNKDEFAKVGLWYSETRGLGGSKFWDGIKRQSVKLV
ncbi:HET-domain-containing protein [Nemania abortiva]|nr:HET-domain-containing protein [Nemania abortiva]